MIIALIGLLADLFQIEPGHEAAGNCHECKGQPKTVQVLRIDAGDTRDDHDIEEETRQPVQQIIVLVPELHPVLLLRLAKEGLDKHRQR